MDFLLVLIGLVVGAGGCYVYLEWRAKEAAEVIGGGAQDKVREFMSATKSCHEMAFPRFGIAEKAKIDAFNKLWDLAALEEKGYPEP